MSPGHGGFRASCCQKIDRGKRRPAGVILMTLGRMHDQLGVFAWVATARRVSFGPASLPALVYVDNGGQDVLPTLRRAFLGLTMA